MKLVEKIDQRRRDFTGIYECEGCGSREQSYGYDDRYFHDTVIPDAKCGVCKKSRNDMGLIGAYTETRYPEGMTV